MAICRQEGSAPRTASDSSRLYTHPTSSPDRLSPELGKEDVADFLRDRRDDVNETRDDGGAMLLGDGGFESVQVDRLACRDDAESAIVRRDARARMRQRFEGGACFREPHESPQEHVPLL